MLVWFAILGKFNTKSRLVKLNILQDLDDKCTFCNSVLENIEHLFLHCKFMWKIWCTCLSWEGLSWSVARNLSEQFHAWLGVNSGRQNQNKWISLFFVIVWAIWRQRNKIVFDKEAMSKVTVCELIKHCWNSWFESQVLSNGQGQRRSRPYGDNLQKHTQLATIHGDYNRMTYCWICVEFIISKNLYAAGGYLLKGSSYPMCFIYDFIEANSECEAIRKALEIMLQTTLEEIGCMESELILNIQSALIYNWLKGDLRTNWDMRFVRNKFLQSKDWFKNVSVVLINRKQNIWFKKWKNRLEQVNGRSIIWHNEG